MDASRRRRLTATQKETIEAGLEVAETWREMLIKSELNELRESI